MMILRAFVLSSLVLGFLRVACADTPVLQAEDTFTYSAGSILGQNGGTGWSGAWINPYSPNGVPLQVDSSGRLVFGSGSIIQSAGRSLTTRFSSATASKVYITFDVQFGTQSGGGTPNLRLLDSTLGGALTGGLGNNGNTTNYAILDSNLNAGGTSSVSLATAANILFVIDYTQNQSSLWVGNSSWDMTSPPSTGADATFAFAPTFDRLDLYVRELSYFDNLRVYSVAAIPEPGTYAVLLGAAAGGFALLRRRRV